MSKPNIDVLIGGPNNKHSYTYKEVILKENLPISQQMVEKNRKYVVKWNFDLNGETVTVPENCILEFNGGSICNGTLVGQDTVLIYHQELENAIKDIQLSGTFIYKSGGTPDDTTIELKDNKLQIKNDGIHGTHLNADVVDDEDIHLTVDNKLQFKDRSATDGMGRVILRKNIVNGINTLTQSMINQPNTIYVIQYDFTLGEDITVPENCVLEFDGGSISGEHTVAGTNTCIDGGLVKIFNTDVSMSGSWNVSEAYPEWFGGIPNNENIDCGNAINKAYTISKIVKLKAGTYNITTGIVLTTGNSLFGSGIGITKIKDVGGVNAIITLSDDVWKSENTIKDFDIIGYESITLHGVYGATTNSAIIENLSIGNCTNAIYFSKAINNSFSNIFISYCTNGITFTNNSYFNRFYSIVITECSVGIDCKGQSSLHFYGIDIEAFKNKAVNVEGTVTLHGLHMEDSGERLNSEEYAITVSITLNIYSGVIETRDRKFIEFTNFLALATFTNTRLSYMTSPEPFALRDGVCVILNTYFINSSSVIKNIQATADSRLVNFTTRYYNPTVGNYLGLSCKNYVYNEKNICIKKKEIICTFDAQTIEAGSFISQIVNDNDLNQYKDYSIGFNFNNTNLPYGIIPFAQVEVNSTTKLRVQLFNCSKSNVALPNIAFRVLLT